jgi:nitrogen fixation NifU-like protein
MKNSLDDFADKLQEEIFEETREAYGEEVFSRWQNPRFMGKMTNGSSVGRVTGRCGDSMEIYLRIMNGHVEEANFFTDGCGASVACGSVAAELACSKGLDEAAQIGGDTILEALGGLPEEEAHCAFLAAAALMAAIHQWIVACRDTDKR